MATIERNHWVLLISTPPVPATTDVTQWRSDEIMEKIQILVSWRDGKMVVPLCRTGVLQDIVKATMDAHPMMECLLREKRHAELTVRTGGVYTAKSSYTDVIDLVTAAIKSGQSVATPVDRSVVYPLHVNYDPNYPQQLMSFNRYMCEACPDNEFALQPSRKNQVAWLTIDQVRSEFPQQSQELERIMRAYQYHAT